MSKNETEKYRAGVAGIIINENREFLLLQSNCYREDEWDFVKGGRDFGESDLEALKREIKEEVSVDVAYEILEKSAWNVIYEWPKKLQETSGLLGQARVHYWLRYKGGDIKIQEEEIRKYTWVSEDEIVDVLKKSHFPDADLKIFWREWEEIREKYF